MTALSTLLGGNRAFGRGYIDGLILANGTDADHDINIAAGECRDSTNTYNMVLGSTLVKQIDAAWAAGNNAGGLFSGSVGNSTWYHVFLIRKDSDGSIDAGFDTSVTAANRPAGYSTYRRIGSVLTNGSANILGFVQNGDKFFWTISVYDISGSEPPTAASQSLTVTVPLGVKVTYLHLLAWRNATTQTIFYLYSKNSPQASFCPAVVANQFFYGGPAFIESDENSQVYWRANQAGGIAYVTTMGWIDPRGKDA